MRLMLMLAALAVFSLSAFAWIPAAKAELPEGMSCLPRNIANCTAWWERRSPAQKNWLISHPPEDRNAAIICMFLMGFPLTPDAKLNACAWNRIVSRRGEYYCAAQGHEILTTEMEICRKQWIADNGARYKK